MDRAMIDVERLRELYADAMSAEAEKRKVDDAAKLKAEQEDVSKFFADLPALQAKLEEAARGGQRFCEVMLTRIYGRDCDSRERQERLLRATPYGEVLDFLRANGLDVSCQSRTRLASYIQATKVIGIMVYIPS